MLRHRLLDELLHTGRLIAATEDGRDGGAWAAFFLHVREIFALAAKELDLFLRDGVDPGSKRE